MKKLIFSLLCLPVCSHATLYGPDTRELITPSKQSNLSRSVAVMVANSAISISQNGQDLRDLDTAPLTENQFMCNSERFANLQSFFVSCTGFLIAPDVLVTAGHCATTFGEVHDEANPYCTDFSWYFDFQADDNGNVKTKDIPASEIYQCEKVLRASHASVQLSDREILFKDDFAILKLKKMVQNRPALNLTKSRPAKGESLSMIGHPLGGPKMSVTGSMLSNESTFDRAAINGFDGNSGSPVFNSKNQVFGILVRGYPPSLIDSKNDRSCSVVNHCSVDAKICDQADPNGQTAGDHIMPLSLIPEIQPYIKD